MLLCSEETVEEQGKKLGDKLGATAQNQARRLGGLNPEKNSEDIWMMYIFQTQSQCELLNNRMCNKFYCIENGGLRQG